MHLLQLHAISHDLRKISRQLRSHGYGVPRCLTVQKDNHLANQFVHIDQFPFQAALLE